MSARIVPFSHPVNQLAELRARVRHYEGTIAHLEGRRREAQATIATLDRQKAQIEAERRRLETNVMQFRTSEVYERGMLDQVRAQLRNLEQSGVVR